MHQTDHIDLSAFVVQDLPAIVKWRNDPEVNAYLRQGIRTLQEIQKWHAIYFTSGENRLFAINFSKKLIGYCTIEGVDNQNRKCELGIVIGAKEYWHKGVGSATIRRLTEIAFVRLQKHRVFAMINADNIASLKCFSRAGFHYEGTLREAKYVDGVYRDIDVYSILEKEWKTTNHTCKRL